MIRSHIAKSTNQITLHETNPLDDPHGPGKPHGFWYQVDGDWERWADGESFHIGNFIHTVELNDCNVLQVPTLLTLDELQTVYGEVNRFEEIDIRWDKIAVEWDGIEITPYQWNHRLAMFWYYSWDCASGCIWRPRNASVSFSHERDAIGVGGRMNVLPYL